MQGCPAGAICLKTSLFIIIYAVSMVVVAVLVMFVVFIIGCAFTRRKRRTNEEPTAKGSSRAKGPPTPDTRTPRSSGPSETDSHMSLIELTAEENFQTSLMYQWLWTSLQPIVEVIVEDSGSSKDSVVLVLSNGAHVPLKQNYAKVFEKLKLAQIITESEGGKPDPLKGDRITEAKNNLKEVLCHAFRDVKTPAAKWKRAVDIYLLSQQLLATLSQAQVDRIAEKKGTAPSPSGSFIVDLQENKGKGRLKVCRGAEGEYDFGAIRKAKDEKPKKGGGKKDDHVYEALGKYRSSQRKESIESLKGTKDSKGSSKTGGQTSSQDRSDSSNEARRYLERVSKESGALSHPPARQQGMKLDPMEPGSRDPIRIVPTRGPLAAKNHPQYRSGNNRGK